MKPSRCLLAPMNCFHQAPARFLASRYFRRSGIGLLACLSTGPTWAAMPVDSTRKLPFYVGLQLVNFRFTGLGQTDAEGQASAYRGLMPTMGYQLSRRAKVEVGAIWRGQDIAGKMVVVEYPNGGLYRYYDSYNSRVVPLVVRYSLVPRLRHWGAEAIAGFALLHSRVEGNRSMTEPGQTLQPFSVGGFTEANDLPLLLGTAVTYNPTHHWTIRGEGRLNWSWLGSTVGAVLFGGVFLPQSGVSVGVQYNFGLSRS
jgi:hypothetical protein